ncbi:MAG: adenylate cyclase [Clostridiales bacterium]|nr:adenylate cyclase [Clostridiales bacterium]MDN5281306.1 adenylate cyclase [Candidatus Ozemobacter sp.]
MREKSEFWLNSAIETFNGVFSERSRFSRLLHYITHVGSLPDDTDEEKLQKALLSLLACFGFVAGICLGIHDVVFDFPTRGITTFSYSLVTLLGFIHLKYTRQFKLFRFTQLAFVLCMPFIAQITHGGFVLSGSAIIWALGAPICAVMFHGPAQSIRWFAAYGGLVALAAWLDPKVSQWEAASRLSASPWFFVGHLLGISLILFLLVQFFVFRIKKEQERSEALLLNILPKSIAERLKQNESAIADAFSEATILFADIVGFTEISGKMSPAQLVEILNGIFSRFDRLAEKHKLEKIKTIGDAYMVVGGLPEPENGSAQEVLQMALDMLETMKQFNKENNTDLKIRIGVHSGPVIAGVIGLKKFIYDLWGDAVNVASRMESTGVDGRIQVTEETYLSHKQNFYFEKRGEIKVKGKGEMTTYFLCAKNDV